MILGNQVFIAKKEVTFFFDGVSNIYEYSIVLYLRIISYTCTYFSKLNLCDCHCSCTYLIVRPLVVFGLMLPFDLKLNQKWLVSWGGLRGAAAIAFAIMVVNQYKSRFCGYLPYCLWSLLISSLIQGFLNEMGNRKTTHD